VARERDLYRQLLELGLHTEVEPFLQDALMLLIQIAGARRAAIKLWDRREPTEEALYSLEVGFDDQTKLAASRSVIAETFGRGKVVATGSAMNDPRFQGSGSVRAQAIEAVLCVPIGWPRIVGVLYLQDRVTPGAFTKEDEARALTFARHLSAFVDRLLLRRRHREDPTAELRRTLRADGFVGRSAAAAHLLQQVALVGPLQVGLLITGPSGSGKSQMARLIHDNGNRAQGPFVEVNCGAIPETLVESELFGAAAGAHATANRRLPGKVAAAEGGTLFLDEIGDLPHRAQAALLQLLQSKTYYPLGSATPVRANIRVIAATNADLAAAVAEQRFREDLYHRLNVFPVRMPALSERRQDIPLLAVQLCRRACELNDLPVLELSPEALRAVEEADWPGHVRELAHAVEVAAIRARGDGSPTIERRHVFPDQPGPTTDPVEETSFHAATRRFQERLVREALEQTAGNVSAAARQLSLTRAHLYNLMANFGIRRS
jgi:Nif-specific regulatory protein